MKYKKGVLVICLIICFLSMAGVSASDLNDTVIASDNDLIENDVLTSSESPILEGSSQGTFTDLANEIAYAGGNFSLTRNYTYGSGDSGYKNGITIDKSIIINGNGFSVNGNNAARAFNIRANDVTLNNCNFVDCFNYDSGGAVYWSGANGTLSDCSFVNMDNMINDNGVHCGGAVYWSGANGTLENSNFEDCIVSEFNEGTSASSYGGAVYWKGVNGTLSDCSFIHCEARAYADQEEYYDEMYHNNPSASSYGGAVYWYGDDGIVKDCSFVDCEAYAYAYFSSSCGGGIYFAGKNCSLINPIFENNSAESGPDWYSSQPLMYHIPSGTFTDLANEIASAVGELNLTRDYVYDDEDYFYSGIVIDKSIVINGNGFTIDGNNRARIFNVTASDVVLNNICFVNSNALKIPDDYGAGAAIYWTGANGILSNCSFVNSSSYNDGAVYWYGDNGSLFDCRFVNSRAVGGCCGAIAWYGANGTLYNCSFMNSSATNDGGGAVYWDGANGNLFDCSFVNSFALIFGNGGAVAWYGANGNLSNCSFVNSSVECDYGGGAVFWCGANGTLSYCSFVNSTVYDGDGGAVYWFSSNGIVSDCSFVNSYSSNKGGGIYFRYKNCSLLNSTFENNSAQNGSDWYSVYPLNYKLRTHITALNIATYYASSAKFTIRLTDENNKGLIGEQLRILFNNESYFETTDSNGEFSLFIPDNLTPNRYTVSIYYDGNDDYESSFSSRYVDVMKTPTILTATDVVAVGENASAVTVLTLKDVNGNVISGVKVKIVVGNLSKIARTDANGQVSLDISSLGPGEYRIAARSSATNDIYDEAKASAKAIIIYEDKLDTTLEISDVKIQYGDKGVVVATLKDANGNVISGVKVKIVVGTLSKIARTDKNGQVSLDISSLAPGEYRIAARSAVTDFHKEAKITTAKAIISTNTTLTIPDVKIKQGAAGAMAVATLKDSRGNVVSGVKVKIVVGNLSKIARTDENGQVSLDISSLAPGEYRIAARSSATNDIYNESKAHAKAIIYED